MTARTTTLDSDSAWLGAAFNSSDKLRWLSLERLDKHQSDLYWTDVNLSRHRCYASTAACSLQLAHWAAPHLSRPTFSAMRETATFESSRVGDAFGPSWSTHWFRLEFELLGDVVEADDERELHLLWNSNSEACVYSSDGVPLQGLTSGKREAFVLTRDLRTPGASHVLYVEMACNEMAGAAAPGDFLNPPAGDRTFTLDEVRVAVFDREYWELYWDFRVVADLARHLPREAPRARQALRCAHACINVLDVHNRATWKPARALLQEFLARPCANDDVTVYAVGHCHIDTAWLWPYAETVRKCVRSWATQVRYMELGRHPGFTFAASSAQHFAWVKARSPALFQRLIDEADAGALVPVGASWVEFDANLPSGEAMARQLLLGNRFFRDNLHAQAPNSQPSNVFWLPDTFGYSAALPGILAKAGLRFFMSQKLSWNLINKFPHSSFRWVGLDGSEVLAHFPPSETYNSAADVESILKSASNDQQSAVSGGQLLLFGHGDGGGGPTPEMLAQLDRLQNTRGVPRVRHSAPEAFFERLETVRDQLPVWSGELFFELHQGCLTTQAAIKQGNARCEEQLRATEFAASLALLLADAPYPQDDLVEAWQRVCLNAFHDVLPGSCIAPVVTDALQLYDAVLDSCATLQRTAQQALITSLLEAQETSAGDGLLLINTLPQPRAVVVNDEHCIVVDPLSVVLASPADANLPRVSDLFGEATAREDAQCIVLENGAVRVVLDRTTGTLSSVGLKRASGEVAELLASPGNQLFLLNDVPLYWDAWDTMLYAEQQRTNVGAPSSVEVESHGPLEARVRLEFRLSDNSHVVQTLRLHASAKFLEFDTTVEWHEAHKFLKVEFPLRVKNRECRYAVQFGSLTRPTHRNTTRDLAQFETCAQHWADLHEYGLGAALMADCKYGFSCPSGRLTLSLLRSPKKPDPDADMGTHHFRYALMPHEKPFQDARVVETAAEFCTPMAQMRTNTRPVKLTSMQLCTIDRPGVILETLKRAHDEPDALIARVYDAYGQHATVRMTWALPRGLASACAVDLIELPRDCGESALSFDADSQTLEFSMRPFEVRTFKLSPQRSS